MDMPKPKPPVKVQREEVRKVKETKKERGYAPHLTHRPFDVLKSLKVQEDDKA